MLSLTKDQIIIALQKLSDFMINPNDEFNAIMNSASNSNGWFTIEEVKRSMISLAKMLNKTDLEQWFKNIELAKSPKKVGLILAGNIPLVGFHDVLCVLATGNVALIKMSSSDDKLLPAILSQLIAFEPIFANHIEYTERLKEFDAIIAYIQQVTDRWYAMAYVRPPESAEKSEVSSAHG